VEGKVEEGDDRQLGICASDRALEPGERISWGILGGIVGKCGGHRWIEGTLEEHKLVKEIKRSFEVLKSTKPSYEGLGTNAQIGNVL